MMFKGPFQPKPLYDSMRQVNLTGSIQLCTLRAIYCHLKSPGTFQPSTWAWRYDTGHTEDMLPSAVVAGEQAGCQGTSPIAQTPAIGTWIEPLSVESMERYM